MSIQCLEAASKFAISRLFVEQHFKQETKEKADEMVDNIRATFRRMLQEEADWMDATTRARALEKESVTKQSVAYPQWLLDNEELDKIASHFGELFNVTVKKGKYFETMVELKRLKVEQDFADFYDEVSSDQSTIMEEIRNIKYVGKPTNFDF